MAGTPDAVQRAPNGDSVFFYQYSIGGEPQFTTVRVANGKISEIGRSGGNGSARE
jgi:hypothetical protein